MGRVAARTKQVVPPVIKLPSEIVAAVTVQMGIPFPIDAVVVSRADYQALVAELREYEKWLRQVRDYGPAWSLPEGTEQTWNRMANHAIDELRARFRPWLSQDAAEEEE